MVSGTQTTRTELAVDINTDRLLGRVMLDASGGV
jgi:hypothetical protein